MIVASAAVEERSAAEQLAQNRRYRNVKTIGLLLAALVGLSGQAPAPAAVRHLVYEFGYNTKVASSGQGTGRRPSIFPARSRTAESW